jgi:hypothetical protein
MTESTELEAGVPAMRVVLWTGDGLRQADADAELTGTVVLLVTRAFDRGLDLYATQAVPEEGAAAPFQFVVHESGALFVSAGPDDEFVRVYAPGEWEEVNPLLAPLEAG